MVPLELPKTLNFRHVKTLSESYSKERVEVLVLATGVHVCGAFAGADSGFV